MQDPRSRGAARPAPPNLPRPTHLLRHREADALDAAIRALKGEACHLDVRRPAGVPRSHWWFHLSGTCA
jgi:hypothetical protein